MAYFGELMQSPPLPLIPLGSLAERALAVCTVARNSPALCGILRSLRCVCHIRPFALAFKLIST